jgi:hypothetical protein
MRCHVCNRDKIDPKRKTSYWTEITGYDQPRADGGTNAVALRDTTGRVICNECMIKAKAGLHVGQTSLV